MKKTLKRNFIGFFATGILLGACSAGMAGESLYEYYTDTPINTLKQETKVMGQKLKDIFGHNSLAKNQQKIDFAEYYSNLKKMIVYATKLSAYSEYEKDLKFARDHEVFKGLPKEIMQSDNKEPLLDRRDFVKNKYNRLTENIAEEIDTYQDLIYISLDTCETLVNNDLSDFSNNKSYHGKVNQFVQGNDYTAYTLGKDRFSSIWPKLAARINIQVALWAKKLPSPDAPLVDRVITEAL